MEHKFFSLESKLKLKLDCQFSIKKTEKQYINIILKYLIRTVFAQ